MIHRGVAGVVPLVRRRQVVVAAVLGLLVAAGLVVHLSERAGGADPSRCERFAAESVRRAAAVAGTVTGTGPTTVVIGDSWSAGLGLDDPATSWPSRLADPLGSTVRVAAFSGSGFSETASDCGAVSFADRAPAALRGGADLVVVEGGLNDFDQTDAAIRAGFDRLLTAVGDHPVVIVGPAMAPSRAYAVPHVDALLADLARAHHVPYVRTAGLELDYLPDRLHPTQAGHDEFGDAVAARVADAVDPGDPADPGESGTAG